MPFNIDHIKESLDKTLPGKEAQYRMANFRRVAQQESYVETPADARVASVINLIYESNGELYTTLIRRTTNPNDRHSGQISFPGGRYEEEDRSLGHVALREAQEEVGVEIEQIELLGRLTELYIPVSNYVVHPFVGFYHGTPKFTPQESEVAEVLTPRLNSFFNPDSRKVIDMKLAQGITLKDVPYFAVSGEIIWGATAMIMNEFLEAVASREIV